MFDLSIFATPEAWISLVTLMFLEIVLGVDNITFIAITTNKLPPAKQHIGRKLGLLGAMVSRCIFLSFASWLVHMTDPLFTINLGWYVHGFAIRDIVLLVGGAYLVVKGIQELRGMMSLESLRAEQGDDADVKKHQIGLVQAIATIMVMDVVFSIDSVITAVGLAQHLIIMIMAVMAAILLMMIFIDWVSDFINNNPEMTVLALMFIVAIGALLVVDALGFHTGVEMLDMPVEKLMVYVAMVFSLIVVLILMHYNKKVAAYRRELESGAQAHEATAQQHAAASVVAKDAAERQGTAEKQATENRQATEKQ